MTKERFLQGLLRDRTGAAAIEMGLLCAMIVLAMMVALQGFAGENEITWNNVSNSMKSAVARGTGG